MNKGKWFWVVVCVCSLALCAGATLAQNVTGSISGVVTDANGGVMANAKVTITNADQNAEVRSITTNDHGQYSATLLPVGRYTVTVETANFKRAVHTGIVLHVDDDLSIDFKLEVGAVTETVTVQAAAVEVNTQDATATGVITGTQVRELSLNSRNYAALVLTVPGASDSGNSDQIFPGATAPLGTNTMTFQINGGRREENNWQVDGADNMDRGSNLTLLSFPSIDSISEFRVVRGVYDAESGRSASGQVNVITRSGTHDLHGGIYEFFRNDYLNANSFANLITNPAAPRSKLRYNDFGGTIGGPVYIPKIYRQRNKTFFFFSEEARRIVTYSPATAFGVPTTGTAGSANMLTGNFAHVVCTQWTSTAGASNPCQAYGTSIANISPVAAAYIKDLFSKFPQPNLITAGNPFEATSTIHNAFNFREDMIRIDHTFGPKLSVNGKILHDSNPTQEAGGLFTSEPIQGIATTSTHSPGEQYSIGATYTPTSTMIVDGGYRFSYGAIISTVIGDETFANSPDVKTALGSSLPFANVLGRVPTITFSVANTGTGIADFGPYNDYNRNQTVYGNFTKVLGAHTLRFGAVFYHYNKHENQLSGSNNGAFTFDNTNVPNSLTTFGGNPVCTLTAAGGGTCPYAFEQEWANFLMGQNATFAQANIDVTANIFDNQFEYYGEDTWRVTRKLTVTYGIRHSFFREPTDASGPGGTSELVNFDPALYNPAEAPCITASGALDVTYVNGFPTKSACNPNYNPLNGLIFANPPTINGIKGTQSPFGSKVGKEFNRAIAPRIGVAWDPWGTGKTSIRAGYGMYFDNGLEFGNPELNVGLSQGFVSNQLINFTSFASPVGAGVSNAITPFTIQSRLPIDYKSPYTQQWSLDAQRQFGTTWMVDLGYFGNNGIHLPGFFDGNQPPVDAYLKCTSLNPCFAGPVAVPANGVSIATPINSTTISNKLNVLRPFVGYGPGAFFGDIYTSNYNSLQAQVQKRLSGSSLINVSYTYSHGLTTDPADRSTGGSAIPQVTGDLRDNYGPTIADRRHVFEANWVWELPWLRGQQGVVGHFLGGWEFSGILAAQTGLPLTATLSNGTCFGTSGAACNDPTGSGCLLSAALEGCRPNQIAVPTGPGLVGASQTTPWFNLNAFVAPSATQITETTERPGAIRAPGFWRTDLSLFKNIRFTEMFTGQFRFEMFNALNHTNPICCVSTSLVSGSYGTINSARDPRIIQLAMKVNF